MGLMVFEKVGDCTMFTGPCEIGVVMSPIGRGGGGLGMEETFQALSDFG